MIEYSVTLLGAGGVVAGGSLVGGQVDVGELVDQRVELFAVLLAEDAGVGRDELGESLGVLAGFDGVQVRKGFAFGGDGASPISLSHAESSGFWLRLCYRDWVCGVAGGVGLL
jgi:hypothetical protein